jgi:ribonuclease-3
MIDVKSINLKGNEMNIEEKIGYNFKDKSYLMTAITHSSYAHEISSKDFNEKIEFLGDAVLELVSSEYIYKTYPKLTEGEMTKARAYAVCEESLAEVANRYGFSDFLRVGKCENKIEGRYRPSILADSVEAVIGAIFLDSGIESVKKFILPNILPRIEEFIEGGNKDYKTKLQELLQVNGEIKIEYEIVDVIGPEHSREFVAEVYSNGKPLGKGKGRSKKEAEMDAARDAMEKENIH